MFIGFRYYFELNGRYVKFPSVGWQVGKREGSAMDGAAVRGVSVELPK